MRVLVTGHKGYIGPVLVRTFLEAGHDVVGLDSDLFAECAFSDDIPQIPELRKDLREVSFDDVEGFDAIIHLAGISNDPIGNLNPELTYEINHRASVRLAELAKEAGCERFIFSSSCSTYGAAGDEFLDETALFNPVTPYGHSKVLVEQDVSKLASDAFSPIFLRNATAYGLSPRLRFDLVINNLVAYALTTGKVYMLSDGTPWRPVVHIADISKAFLAALEAPRNLIHNQALNVGQNTENYSIRDLAEIVAEIIPNCQIEYAPDAGPDKRSYRVDFGKIQQVLPAFKDLTREDFEGPRYRRINHLKILMSTGRLGEDLRWVEQYETAQSN